MEPDSFTKGLYQTREWSDLIIRCGDLEEKVHRAVVCARSGFFRNACSGDWKEANTRVIDFPDDDADLVARMVKWLYTLEYERLPKAQKSHPASIDRVKPLLYEHAPQLKLDARLYSIGEKYAISSLKEAALASFGQALSASRTPTLSKDYEDFAEIFDIIYTSTPVDDQGLRACLRKWLEEDTTGNVLDSPKLLPMYGKCPDMASVAIDVIHRKIQQYWPADSLIPMMRLVWNCHFGIETCGACEGHSHTNKHDASSPGGSSADCQIISATDFSQHQIPNQVTKKRKLLSDADNSEPLMARYLARVSSTERFLVGSENRDSSPLRSALQRSVQSRDLDPTHPFPD